jgi:choloylglycine hydrolase
MRTCRISAILFAVIAIHPMPTTACTGIRIHAENDAVICARTLEFGMDLCSNVIIVPRGKSYVGTTSIDRPGLSWTTKYGATGANAFGLPVIVDGVNEKGLAVGIFYFPGYAKYQQTEPADVGQSLAPWELPIYLLGSCTNVAEALAAVKSVRVGEVVQRDFGFVPPCHYVIHDSAGQSAVLEYVDGELRTYANPLGVFSNAPTFDWHMTNLRNYVNLSVTNMPPVEMQGIKLSGFGQGNGLLGLPGDFTPPSRLVRAVAFSQSAVLQAFHILNQFDIPRGAVRDVAHGEIHDEYTLWTSASDMTNHRYHFHTFANRRIRMIDLAEVDLDAADIKTVSMAGDEVIEDLSKAGR